VDALESKGGKDTNTMRGEKLEKKKIGLRTSERRGTERKGKKSPTHGRLARREGGKGNSMGRSESGRIRGW